MGWERRRVVASRTTGNKTKKEERRRGQPGGRPALPAAWPSLAMAIGIHGDTTPPLSCGSTPLALSASNGLGTPGIAASIWLECRRLPALLSVPPAVSVESQSSGIRPPVAVTGLPLLWPWTSPSPWLWCGWSVAALPALPQ